jgi:hypothetical protein
MAGSRRAVSVAAAIFVVTFVTGLALLADELGAFGDSDRAFIEHFSSGSQRGADIAVLSFLSAQQPHSSISHT